MIGFWNKSVYITYMGAFASILGLLIGIKYGNMDYAFIGMIVASVCDIFDGKVARHIPNRTNQEKNFGVEIDSLADIIAFIVVPMITLYMLGMNEVYQIIIISLYTVCGIVRLGYFNAVMSDKDQAIVCYTGLPVPASVIALSFIWIITKMFNINLDIEIIIMTVIVPILGYLHISKIKVKKITDTWFYIMCTILAILAIFLGMFAL